MTESDDFSIVGSRKFAAACAIVGVSGTCIILYYVLTEHWFWVPGTQPFPRFLGAFVCPYLATRGLFYALKPKDKEKDKELEQVMSSYAFLESSSSNAKREMIIAACGAVGLFLLLALDIVTSK